MEQLRHIWADIAMLGRSVARTIVTAFDRSPIAEVETLETFVGSRAAFLAQNQLYGYLKTRMGTKFRDFFEDETFAASIRISAVKVFAACLADLSVFAVATVSTRAGLSREESVDLARRFYRNGLDRGADGQDFEHIPPGAVAAFDQRLEGVVWSAVAQGEAAFSESPAALVRYAPVIDEFRELDREIVMNSMRFKWRDIREQLRTRLDAEAVAAALKGGASGAGG